MSPTGNVVVRLITPDDADSLASFATRNRAFHGDEMVLPSERDSWRRLAAADQRWYRVDHAGHLAGVLSLSRWSGPPWCCAELGAGADEASSGGGILSAGLRTLLDAEIRNGELERVEALVAPTNVASQRFVAAGGLRLEGTARGALWRDGHRVDMERWAIVSADLLDDRVA